MTNKKIIIIGASSGIGRSLAMQLAQAGNLVVAAARSEEKLLEIKNAYPKNIIVQKLDVNETSQALAVIEELITKLGGLDIMIISAGIGFQNPELNFAKELKTINTNIIGFTAISDLAFNYFIQQKRGQLVGISSIIGLRGEQGAPAYSASKAYQINYLESLRQKAGRLKLDITVTDIRPGFVQTQMAQGDNIFWSAPAEKAAKQIIRAIAKKKDCTYITKRWTIIAWALKLIPRAWYKRAMFSKNG